MPERAGDLAAGLALLIGGAVSWTRRPRAGAGPLMVVTGLVWFAGDLSSALLYAYRARSYTCFSRIRAAARRRASRCW